MGLTSALNEAEDALKATVAARPNLAGIPIALGEPPRIAREHLWIAEAAEATQRWDVTKQAGGTGQREERFELGVKVYVERLGETFKPTRDRASALAEEVEAAVVVDHTLGGAVWFAEVVGIGRESGVFDDNRAVLMTVRVRVTHYLS
jgi:hypothetical protein